MSTIYHPFAFFENAVCGWECEGRNPPVQEINWPGHADLFLCKHCAIELHRILGNDILAVQIHEILKSPKKYHG